MSLIHVIIPVYKAEEFLENTVASVLNQPCRNIDIVLVDDGSPDNSGLRCDEIAAREPRVKVIHQENGGVCAARNAGIEYVLNHSAGDTREMIAFLDADDAWVPGVIDNDVEKHLLSDWDEDVIGFSGISTNYDMTRFAEPTLHSPVDHETGNKLMWEAQRIHVGAKLYTLHLLRKWDLRFQSKHSYTEDKIFILQAFFLAQTVRLLRQPLYLYRKNPDGIMGGISKLSAAEHFLPIIDGWISADEFINSWEHVTGKHLRAGQVLAGIYFVDMAADHYRQWRPAGELKKILNGHPHYDLMLRLNQRDAHVSHCKRRDLLLKHPRVFRMKFQLLGLFDAAARLLWRIGPVRSAWVRRKYPHTQIPQIDKGW